MRASAQRSTAESEAIGFRGVTRQSDDGSMILRNIELSLDVGTATSIIGPSGSGKSSLLRLINRLDSPSDGEIHVLGREVSTWPARELRTRAVWVPQGPATTEQTARDFLAVPVQLGVVDARRAAQRLDDALSVAHFDDSLLSRDVTRLSGGERQRLALARALLLDPEILLLDEPTSSLDGENAARVLASLTAWREAENRTLVVVTHRLADVRQLGGTLVMLDKGTVRHLGPSGSILGSPAGEDIRRVLSGEAA